VNEATDPAPQVGRNAFTCPECGAFSQQIWTQGWHGPRGSDVAQLDGLSFSTCLHCGEYAIWRNRDMIFPARRIGPAPHPDMPPEVRSLYEEARAVASSSKRSAAALLRLGLQILIDSLAPGNAPINQKIATLVKAGLDAHVQQAMDIVRVVGNNAVHPGQIDLQDDDGMLPALFQMMNIIVEQVISRPMRVADLFGSLPADARAAIVRRDDRDPNTNSAP
jgi:predicted RNA-binding Zn-ribbon protein involved in translation (DUF1610 family)